MREYVEIGIGRDARKAYELDSISIVPRRRTRSSQDVDTAWHIDAYTFATPILSIRRMRLPALSLSLRWAIRAGWA